MHMHIPWGGPINRSTCIWGIAPYAQTPDSGGTPGTGVLNRGSPGWALYLEGFPMPCTGIGYMGPLAQGPIWAPLEGPYGDNAYPKHGGIDVNMASKGPYLGPKIGPFWGPPGQEGPGFILV